MLMSWEIDPQWEATLGFFGTLAALALFVSPIKTFQRIVKNRSTEEFPSFPYASTMLNCVMWVFYCLPSITPNRTSPLVTNAIGLVFQAAYLSIFVYYAKDKAKTQVRTQIAALCLFFVPFVAFVLGLLPPNAQSPTVGTLASIFTVVMFGAPLSAVAVVLRTRSVEYMPLPLSLMGFTCSATWTVYGIYVRDIFVIVPNVLGMLLGVVQLAIYYKISSEARSRAAYAAVSKDEETPSTQPEGIMMVEDPQRNQD